MLGRKASATPCAFQFRLQEIVSAKGRASRPEAPAFADVYVLAEFIEETGGDAWSAGNRRMMPQFAHNRTQTVERTVAKPHGILDRFVKTGLELVVTCETKAQHVSPDGKTVRSPNGEIGRWFPFLFEKRENDRIVGVQSASALKAPGKIGVEISRPPGDDFPSEQSIPFCASSSLAKLADESV